MSVIMIARLYAMYQQSKKMLIFLITIFLALTIASIVIVAIISGRSLGGKLALLSRMKQHSWLTG
jgi:hypothetical protein